MEIIKKINRRNDMEKQNHMEIKGKSILELNLYIFSLFPGTYSFQQNQKLCKEIDSAFAKSIKAVGGSNCVSFW